MSFDLELTDRRALVTGGTKGIGAITGTEYVIDGGTVPTI
jgi:NAD(P)-dependent dehydrogenase (short-subunit alcohol dehydrogenase family)